MFSKPIYRVDKDIVNEFIHELKNEKKHENTTLSFNEYVKNNIVLKKYKLVQLKQIAKSNKLHVSGSKLILINRIHEYFDKCIKCRKIQNMFRGHIVRKSFTLRGDGYKNCKLCVNESDFYSMEPLNEIPIEFLFTFNSNDNKFLYGCNIVSLLHLIKNKTAVKNPYNRETIKIDVIKKIIKLYNLIKIIFGTPEDAPIINTDSIMTVHNNINDNRLVRESMRQPHTAVILSNEVVNDRTIRLNTMRAKPIQTRMQELFMDIDQLGNYTNYQWFANLERRDYIRLYRTLHDIWTYRGHLSREMKCKICILEDPFHEINHGRVYFHEASIEFIRDICLKIFENMVYCGIDDEHRKIGTLHALSALTIVSANARNAMPWLYESLFP